MNQSEAGKLGGIAYAKKAKILKEERIAKYNKAPSVCTNCECDLEYKKRHNKFCNRSCAATFNNTAHPKKKPRIVIACLQCGNDTKNDRYCSRLCDNTYSKAQTLKRWLESDGTYLPKAIVKAFILNEQDNKCAICSMENVWNGKPIVFVLDHIDGNSEYSVRENLRCVCPNCDSQLDTYKSKNTGNGRHSRRQRYADGKSF